MSIQLTKTYEVLSEHTFTISISQEEYDLFILDNPADEAVDYEDMYDYFEAKGHTVDTDDQALDYQSQGVTVEFIA
jgi:predicted esterase YcpF (UPF0227 family)